MVIKWQYWQTLFSHDNRPGFHAGRFLSMVDTNYSIEHRPSVYATKLHISLVYLRESCRAIFNSSPIHIIHTRILLESGRYLQETPERITDIANFLGFSDVNYFIRLFRQATGQTPSAFRRAAHRKC